MPSPELSNGTYYLRLHVPNDIASRAEGMTLHVPVGDALRAAKVGKVVKVSLRTKAFDEAKLRFTKAYAAILQQWEAIRTGPTEVAFKTLNAIAGQHYREVVQMLEEEPGEAAIWEAHRGLLVRLDESPEARHQWYGPTADKLLSAHGINADQTSRTRLIEELHAVSKQYGDVNLRRAKGDFRPDPDADRFASLPHKASEKQSAAKPDAVLSITNLFEFWKRDHLAAGKSPRTVNDFAHKARSLIEFVGHDDALAVSSETIADWCDHLVHTKGNSARTVSQKYLAVIKLIFALGVEKRKLKESPAKDVKVRFSKPKKARSQGFTDAEALSILTTALADPETLGRRTEENKRAIRWIPWICAFTGARVTEIAQLRTVDLIEENGVLCLRITPEAGSVKTGRFRIVPLHPQLIDMGLPVMIRALPQGPIFYHLRPHKGVQPDPVERSQNVGAKVGEWVRKVAGVTDPVVQPNHAWRHRFKTTAREVGIDIEVRDAIQGHEDGRSASDYGETTIKAMKIAIDKLPRFEMRTAE